MFRFFKTGKEEREITKDELEQAMAQFLEKNANIVYTVLVNDDYTVNYDLLKPYLPAFPTNIFLITKETLEVFEHTEENLNLVKEIDIVQKAVDQYVTEKEMFPIVEGSEDRLICGMKLGPYLDRILKRDLYISEKYYLVSSKPDRKKQKSG
ncbi:TPA: DUF3939 domain-containing protein [Bacillus anthracis]|uniref:DUF3939 domain-containing protein n=1 Tax=Bacillus anthracis TaxID=1392 RepID=UPI0003E561ED|nr:DUF3939 domain-containing protein [Bacillus anthracis]BBB72191.1 hypothetical protein BAZ_02008 [Bacillus anthracis]HDR4343366.1 DUF3939 domain-containing protein [Bacillus anthracis]HDR4380008.1 DUF3939 domain-containing protein [Bacillus anthracis]HDR4386144.1 DUF3939 domain-containing protein [Bacillus anthracis]